MLLTVESLFMKLDSGFKMRLVTFWLRRRLTLQEVLSSISKSFSVLEHEMVVRMETEVIKTFNKKGWWWLDKWLRNAILSGQAGFRSRD